MIGNNTLAQNTPANAQANPDAEVLSNGELTVHCDPTCYSVTAIVQHLTMPSSMISYSLPSGVPLTLTLAQLARTDRVLPSPLTLVLCFVMLNTE
jgi:hypothetical protein